MKIIGPRREFIDINVILTISCTQNTYYMTNIIEFANVGALLRMSADKWKRLAMTGHWVN